MINDPSPSISSRHTGQRAEWLIEQQAALSRQLGALQQASVIAAVTDVIESSRTYFAG